MWKDHQISTKGQYVANAQKVLPRYAVVLKCCGSHWSMDEESFSMSTGWHSRPYSLHVPRYLLSPFGWFSCPYVLSSFLCYDTRCPLQAPTGYHVFFDHDGLPSSSPFSTLRRTSSPRWAHGPEPGKLGQAGLPIPWGHGSITYHAGRPKAPGHMTQNLLDSSTPGAHGPSIHHTGGPSDLGTSRTPTPGAWIQHPRTSEPSDLGQETQTPPDPAGKFLIRNSHLFVSGFFKAF